jgi:hypothetical protein
MKYDYANNLPNSEKKSVVKSVAIFAAKALSKVKHILLEERRLLKRKRIGNEIIPAAPFYDELHFANYE